MDDHDGDDDVHTFSCTAEMVLGPTEQPIVICVIKWVSWGSQLEICETIPSEICAAEDVVARTMNHKIESVVSVTSSSFSIRMGSHL